jgi:glutathione S-transferase
MLQSAKYIEIYWLKDYSKSKPFMFGSKPTIADLSLICELAQM